MSEPFVGEIMMFGGNFAPRGWAYCDGQLLAVSQNDALFSLLGTIYGGDGRTTFGLPALRGRVPIHMGAGPGLTPRPIGQKSGAENVALNASQVAPHNHALNASNARASEETPGGHVIANKTRGAMYFADFESSDTADAPMSPLTTSDDGGLAHPNVQPSLAVHYCIALVGIYPSRT